MSEPEKRVITGRDFRVLVDPDRVRLSAGGENGALPLTFLERATAFANRLEASLAERSYRGAGCAWLTDDLMILSGMRPRNEIDRFLCRCAVLESWSRFAPDTVDQGCATFWLERAHRVRRQVLRAQVISMRWIQTGQGDLVLALELVESSIRRYAAQTKESPVEAGL